MLRTLAALISVILLVCGTARAGEIEIFRIGTAGTKGTYYPIGSLIADALSNPTSERTCSEGPSPCGMPGVAVVAQTSSGSVGNIDAILRGSLESGFVQSDVAYWAYAGEGTYIQEGPKKGLRAIANLYPESIHLVARRTADIQTVEDLAGKVVALDERGSGTLVEARIILHEHGMSEQDLDSLYIKPRQAMERMRKGELDAFFLVAGYPASSISELAEDVEIKLVPIIGQESRRIPARHSFLSRDVIPGGIYEGVPETPTLSVGAQWITRASADEALVYRLTRAFWSRRVQEALRTGHPKSASIRLESALHGIAIPLHVGAARFYREIGLLR